jgi:hypothetical protein
MPHPTEQLNGDNKKGREMIPALIYVPEEKLS